MTDDPNTHSLFCHNSCSRNSLPQLSEQHLQIRNTMELQNDFDPENIQANATDAEKLPINDGSIDGSDSSDDDSDENIDASSASGIASQGTCTVSNDITAEVRQALEQDDDENCDASEYVRP
jgi:hypothetical protein